jgi:tetratricopeptide (TPR) repeat protein
MKRKRALHFLLVTCLALLLASGTVLTYYGCTGNGFVWDTLDYLYQHPFYLSSLGPDHIIWMFTNRDTASWHPLTWLSWAIDYQLYGGLDTWGYHFTNIVLHGINSALLFLLTLTVFGLNQPASGSYPLRTDSAALAGAFFGAALFAVHPQHVESVAWVAERKDVLFLLFTLLSVLAYVKFAVCRISRKRRWFLASLAFFLLALLSKPMVVTFPFVLLLLDIYPLRRSRLLDPVDRNIAQQRLWALIKEKLPFFLLSAFAILLALKFAGAVLQDIPIQYRLLNAFHSIFFYVGKLLLPLHFSPHYAYAIGAGEAITWKAILPMVGFILISLACLWAWRRKHHAWLIAWLFYLVTLSPVIGLIQAGEQGAADRFAYLPTIPVYLFAAAGLLYLLEHVKTARKWLVALPAAAVILLLADKTVTQIKIWKSPLTLWRHAATYSPDSRLANYNLGIANLNHNDLQAAAENFATAGHLRGHPGKEIVWRELVYLKLGSYQEALAMLTQLQILARTTPELKLDANCIQFNIGWTRARLDMRQDARQSFNAVDSDSSLGPAAAAWLEFLAKDPASTEQLTGNNGTLPGYCEALTPLMKVSLWADKIRTNG